MTDRWPRPNFLESDDYQNIWKDQATGRYKTGIDGLWSESGEDPADLRSMPYWQYLKTTHWQLVRQRALVAAGHQCFYCGATEPLDVHHLSYKRRGCEYDEDLIVLCRVCHQTEHDNEADIELSSRRRELPNA